MYENLMKKLRSETIEVFEVANKKHSKKISNLRRKNLNDLNLKKPRIKEKLMLPDTIQKYSSLRCFEECKNQEDNVKTVEGDIETLIFGAVIDSDEAELLKLPPKYSVLKPLKYDDFELEIEATNAKIRWESIDRNLEPSDDDLEIDSEVQEEISLYEANKRQVFQQDKLNFLNARQRVTDLPGNT